MQVPARAQASHRDAHSHRLGGVLAHTGPVQRIAVAILEGGGHAGHFVAASAGQVCVCVGGGGAGVT
jgi:hypothetical protein